MTEDARKAVFHIHATTPKRPPPRVGIILGSGLGGLADRIEDPMVFPFTELPGFPHPTVEGHAGRLVLGRLGSVEVACLQGRVHLYEGHDPTRVKVLVRTLALLGCGTLVITNAAGALDPTATPGSLMLIRDHINFQGRSPLVGPNDDEFGPRFPAMNDAYDPALRAHVRQLAEALAIPLREGVYLGALGPQFETPAEIRAFIALGADAVGMSTVPEVIVARHAGVRVVAISVLTNLAAGLADETLTHQQTLDAAAHAAGDLERLVTTFVHALGESGDSRG